MTAWPHQLRASLMGVMTVALVATACAPTTPGAGTAATGTPAAATAAPKPAIARDEIVVLQATVIDSMDPHIAARDDARVILRRIAQPLVDRDPGTLQPAPALATAWKQVDPETWEFALRDVTFTNGEPFTASTVKFNFDRILDPDLKSVLRSSFQNILARVDVVNEHTVRLVTKTPYPMMLERLTTVLMVPEKLVREQGNSAYAAKPIGTGPYKFVEWVQGERVTLERNSAYWGAAPYFEKVVYRQIAEASTAVAELVSGGAHIVTTLPFDQEQAVRDSGAEVIGRKGVNTLDLRMDPLARTEPNPFENKRVRHAVHYAVDREGIAKNLLGGHTQPIATSVVPGMFGHDPSIKPREYDPEKAKQLLAEAGYPDGFEVRFLWYPVSNWRQPKQIVEAIAADLAAVGIRTRLFGVGASEISTYTRPGKAGPLYIGNNANGGFYDGAFAFFYLRERYKTLSYYWNDELESLIVKAETSADPEERKRALAAAQRHLHEEAPYLWLFQGFELTGHDKRLDMSTALVASDLVIENIKPR